jgi:NRAMP (natural resistance-associated macrophage protein)-like metal ion transporter
MSKSVDPAPAKPAYGGWLSKLGPGLITGASDDDPSGIATYSQAGAQFGYSLGWTLVLSFPLMIAIQEACARLGRISGKGLATNIAESFPKPIGIAIALLLLVANTINLGADLGAMAAALQLLIPGPGEVYVLGFGLACGLLITFVSYERYSSYLKWLCLSVFAYVGIVSQFRCRGAR